MNNQIIKLAIVIPFFKLDYFEKTLESLANQTNKNFNLYIGDDFSPETPLKLLEKYKDKINYKYKRFDDNLGGQGKLVEQWNRCISLSINEEWIMILADDDYISTNFIESFYSNLHVAIEKKINLLRFKIRQVTFDDIYISDIEHLKFKKGKEYLWEDQIHQSFISISENIFRRSVYNELGFRNYPLAWRVPFMMYLDFTKNGDVLGINDAFVAVRVSENQLTRRKDVNHYKRLAMKECYYDILIEYEKLFNKSQNLNFLKVYYYYNKEQNRMNNNFLSLFYKYGGITEASKYFIKKIFNI